MYLINILYMPNTGKRERRKNLRHPQERFLLVSNPAEPRWRPEIFPLGVWDIFLSCPLTSVRSFISWVLTVDHEVWDFSVFPSYRCLILFLTNFPILYVFRCLILFLTRHLCFAYIPSKVFPQNSFPLVKLIVDLSIYIHVLAVF
jgi:hypothetical protein